MSAKCTPGPWTVKTGSDARDFIVAEPTGNTVCEPNIEMFMSPADFDPSIRRIGLAEATANAHLIAASPELLVALKRLALANSPPEDRAAWAYAHRAIAKAEGR